MSNNGGLSAQDGSIAIGLATDCIIQIINIKGDSLTDAEIRKRESHYLRRMINDCGGLEWLDQMEFSDGETPALSLNAVYTPQCVIEREHFEHDLPRDNQSREARPLSAVEVLNRESRLVLTGAPGSGKSAFVNYLVLCLAGEGLAETAINLQALTEPLPDENGNPQQKRKTRQKSDTQEVRQPWDHGALIPVRVILRDFAASTAFPEVQESGDACHVLNFLRTELIKWGCEDYWPILEARLQEGKVLLLFDGLDEVPEASQRRSHLIECIRGMARSYPDSRILVTCRPYAYRQKTWRLELFADATLAEFGRGQVLCFIDRWYQQPLALNPKLSEGRKQTFKQALLKRKSLFELIQRPLMLSLTAYLHARRHELPDRRADLYESLLELLINKWEKARFNVSDSQEAHQLEQYGLAEFLRIEQKTIHTILKRLAFAAHARQPESAGTADIPGKDLINELVFAAKDVGHTVNAPEICDYLRDRVGILYQRSEENGRHAIYTFPHRSFQEYLTAAYFMLEEDELFQHFAEGKAEPEYDYWPELLAHLVQTEADRWREVALLAAGKQIEENPRFVWDLLAALYPEDAAETLSEQEWLWGLRLAGEILAENLKYARVRKDQQVILDRIQKALPMVLVTSYLPAAERVATGNHLAVIGDLRPEISEVNDMPFCLVPAGAFWMGKGMADEKHEEWSLGETPAGEYDLDYPYWLAQYPITVAQFAQFVNDSQQQPEDENSLKGNLNDPVVDVSWQEAMAFCHWLTQRWLPQGWQVSLPNEPEWEKAARGGVQIPSEPVIETISTGMGSVNSPQMQANPFPQRRYPWGNSMDDECLNYAMNIGQVSTPGVYPSGQSVYGCEDLSGNVWEWTRSKDEDYPYPKPDTDQWRQREAEDDDARRVLRGGAFDDYQGHVRAAVRRISHPYDRFNYIVFRVCLSPFL